MKQPRALVVPVRDRRRSRRIVTLKNFRNVTLVMLAVFAAITIRSEMRGPGPRPDSYGRLYQRELPAPVQKRAPERVLEAEPVADHISPDPTLHLPELREQQYLSVEPLTAEGSATATMIASEPPMRARDGRVAIVGGPEGVAIVEETRRRPVLSGGFGR